MIVSGLLLLYSSCGSGVNVEKIEGAVIHSPVAAYSGGKHTLVIDENRNLWQFLIGAGDNNVMGLTQVNLENVHQAGIHPTEIVGYAVTTDGKIWLWSVFNPEQMEEHTVEEPVQKVIFYENFELYLHIDGTFSVTPAPTRMSSGRMDDTFTQIKYDEFKDIVDVIRNDFILLALDKSGDLWMAGKTGDSPEMLGNSLEINLSPVKVLGLPPIKRLVNESPVIYAIDENDQLHYLYTSRIFGNSQDGFNPIDLKATHVSYYRATTREGELYGVGGFTNEEGPTVYSPEEVYPNQGYGHWQVDRSFTSLLFLDKEGFLSVYDVNPYRRGDPEAYTNPRRVGEIKVRMDYFTQ